MSDTLVNDIVLFVILDAEVELFQSETAYGLQTASFVDGQLHYLKDEPVSLETAINLWQDINDRPLTQDEFNQVDVENNLIPEDI